MYEHGLHRQTMYASVRMSLKLLLTIISLLVLTALSSVQRCDVTTGRPQAPVCGRSLTGSHTPLHHSCSGHLSLQSNETYSNCMISTQQARLPPSLPHSLILSFSHSLPPSLPPSFPHSLILLFPPSLVPSFPHSLIPSFPPQLPEILELMGGYLENLHQAKQELSLAFTKEEFITLVQVSGEGRGREV